MLDFTIERYQRFLDCLQSRNYEFQSLASFIESPAERVVILRHDIDARKENALLFAKIQSKRHIHGSYYFRMVPKSFNREIIQTIAGMGHEIGYHYETMDTLKGDAEKAFHEFSRNLEEMRKIADVRTICMHGSPHSRFDNKDIWKKFNYRDLGIIGEPYFDIDFNEVAYLTDTGRRWNGSNSSIRDKVVGRYDFNFRSTAQIIEHVNKLPNRVMFTFHPQRWTDDPISWLTELVLQNIKNQVKAVLLKKSKEIG